MKDFNLCVYITNIICNDIEDIGNATDYEPYITKETYKVVQTYRKITFLYNSCIGGIYMSIKQNLNKIAS